MITINVTYRFDSPSFSPIERGDTNEETFRAAIEANSGSTKDVLAAIYRELVLGNYATFDEQSGYSAEEELNRAYPDSGVLPGFVRTSGRFNAAGMIWHNIEQHRDSSPGYRLLPSMLAALVEGGALEPPRIPVSQKSESSRT
jgi:hypothetical protein